MIGRAHTAVDNGTVRPACLGTDFPKFFGVYENHVLPVFLHKSILSVGPLFCIFQG